MSKVSIELNDVKSNIFQKGNYVISKDRAIIILVSTTRLSGVHFSGVCIYSSDEFCQIGEYNTDWLSDKFDGLFEGKIIIE